MQMQKTDVYELMPSGHVCRKKNSTDTETIAVSYDMSKQIEHFQFRLTRARLVTKHATCRQNRQLVAETGDSVDEV